MLILTCCVAAAAFALGPGDTAPAFKLDDQFGKNWDSAALKNSVVVLVVADKDSGRDMGPWVDKLKAKYSGKVTLLGLLDLHSVPGIGRGIARNRIKKETKEPLMLDFKGDIGKAYMANSKEPVVVVIGKGLAVKAVQKTKYTDAAFGTISSAIDAALK